MSRKLLIAIAVMSVALVGTSFAAVENIKVSGDINSQAVARDLGLGGAPGSPDGATDTLRADGEHFLFSQVRLRFDADLTEGVSAVVALINEKLWGTEDSSTTDDVDLDLAYVTLKEFMYEPLTLIVGRQNLRYGNGLIVGDPDTNQVAANSVAAFGDLSKKKSFDAIRAILDFSPYTIDVVYAAIDENTLYQKDGENLYGINVAYSWNSYNGITEAYAFYRDSTNNTEDIENEDDVLTLGVRSQADVNDNLTLGLEVAHQSGSYQTGLTQTSSATDSVKRDAWAVQAISEYRFLNDYNSKVGLIYAYLTGEGPTTGEDGEHNGWNPMYEDQAIGELANLFLANTGFQYICATGSMMPREDLTIGGSYLYAYATAPLAATSGSQNLATITGAAGGPIAGNVYDIERNNRDLAHEIDVYAIFDYTEDVQINMNTAFLLPGGAFAWQNNQPAYSLRIGMNVDF
ncbi:MAG: hypothetical protein K9L86_06560 [Candidatus Omnitrophica bacterium]|nr:hypothetical protein [Candidatus Omnitrophota bacterium]